MQEILLSHSEIVYKVGDQPDTIFSVISGFIILRRPSPGGASHEQLFGPGAVFGAAEVLAGTVRTATARAHGDAVVAAHLPVSILNAMIDKPDTANAMVASLLAMATHAHSAEDGQLQINGPNTVRLIPLGQVVIDQMGNAPLTIDCFPYFIGRKSENSDIDIDGPTDGHSALALLDQRPFRLSRRHLAIDREDGQFIIRDYRSFHGTIVNGIPLTAENGGLKIPLDPGENEIIAGDDDSPFRFICIVPTLAGT